MCVKEFTSSIETSNTNVERFDQTAVCCIDENTFFFHCDHGRRHFRKNSLLYQFLSILSTQLTFTCSKSTVEAIEKGVKYVYS